MNTLVSLIFIMAGGILIGIGSELKGVGPSMITCGCVLIGATLYFAMKR